MHVYLEVMKEGFLNCHFICEFNFAVAMSRFGLFILYGRKLVFCCCEISFMEGFSWNEILAMRINAVMKLRSRCSILFFIWLIFSVVACEFSSYGIWKCGFDLASGALASSFITELCVEHICLLNLT